MWNFSCFCGNGKAVIESCFSSNVELFWVSQRLGPPGIRKNFRNPKCYFWRFSFVRGTQMCFFSLMSWNATAVKKHHSTLVASSKCRFRWLLKLSGLSSPTSQTSTTLHKSPFLVGTGPLRTFELQHCCGKSKLINALTINSWDKERRGMSCNHSSCPLEYVCKPLKWKLTPVGVSCVNSSPLLLLRLPLLQRACAKNTWGLSISQTCHFHLLMQLHLVQLLVKLWWLRGNQQLVLYCDQTFFLPQL